MKKQQISFGGSFIYHNGGEKWLITQNSNQFQNNSYLFVYFLLPNNKILLFIHPFILKQYNLKIQFQE